MTEHLLPSWNNAEKLDTELAERLSRIMAPQTPSKSKAGETAPGWIKKSPLPKSAASDSKPTRSEARGGKSRKKR